MSKPFFYRIDLVDLFDFATDSDGLKMSLLEFVKELKKGESTYPAIQKIIDQTHNYMKMQEERGRLGGIAKANKKMLKQTEADLSSTKGCLPLPNSSNSNNSSNNKEEDKTFSASLDAGQENEDFYLTAKKRKLTGERLTTFNQFMDTFGDKRGRAQAADVWIDLKITRKVFDDIIRGATRYANQRATIQAQGHTPKMAQGWLSGRRWEDEQPEAQRKLEVCL